MDSDTTNPTRTKGAPGRRSGQPFETPVAWFADGDARLVIASGGRSADPNWCPTLTAHPDRAAVELPDQVPQPVPPHTLDGADRDEAWQHIVAANPLFAKYQSKHPAVPCGPAHAALTADTPAATGRVRFDGHPCARRVT